MKIKLLVLTSVLVAQSAFAIEWPWQTRNSAQAPVREISATEKFCRNDMGNFQKRILDERNRLAFANSGGPMNIGLCWWHSQFTRNANYLTVFNKNAPVDSADVIVSKIKKIMEGTEVVEINGYTDLYEFSDIYENTIKDVLGSQQLYDSFVKQTWVSGASSGTTSMTESDMQSNLIHLDYKVNVEKKVVYQMLQMTGPAAHAWLVVGVTSDSEGYTLKIVDSNFYQVQTWKVGRGSDAVYGVRGGNFASYGEFFPVTFHESKIDDYKAHVRSFCLKKGNYSLL